MSLKRLAGQTAIYGLSSIVPRVLNYLLVPLYTRIFLPAEYGVVTEMYAYSSFLMILFTYGMETAYFRFASKQTENRDIFSTIMLSILASSALLILLFSIFSGSLAETLTKVTAQSGSAYKRYIIWFVVIAGLDAIASIPFAKLRLQNKAFRFAFIRFINILVNIGLNLFFLVLCPKLPANSWLASFYNPAFGVEYVFIANLISSGLTLLLLLPEFKGMHFYFDKKLWNEIMVYAFPLLFAGFAGMINETADRILIKYLVVDKSDALIQLGIYGACYKVSILMTLFIQTFRYAAEPFFFSHAEREDAKHTYARVMHYFVITCCVIFLSVMLYMDYVKYFIGIEFRSGLHVVPILLMANLCLGVYYNLSIWYKLTGKTQWGAYIALFGAAITLILNIILIPTMGYTGAAWATLICYAAMMIASYIVGQKFYHVDYHLSSGLSYIGAALVVYFFSNYLRSAFGNSPHTIIFFNTALLMMFVTAVWLIERRKKTYLRAS